MIESYGRSVIGNGYSSLYSLYIFALFFPHKSYCFNIRLTVILTFWNWYICLIFFKVLWIPKCSYNGCLCIFYISCFCSFIGICNLLFSFCNYLLCFRIHLYKLLLVYIVILVRLFYRK